MTTKTINHNKKNPVNINSKTISTTKQQNEEHWIFSSSFFGEGERCGSENQTQAFMLGRSLPLSYYSLLMLGSLCRQALNFDLPQPPE